MLIHEASLLIKMGVNMRFALKSMGVLLVAAFTFSMGMASAADVAKIGILDFQRILETSEVGKAAQAEINREGLKMEKDLEAKGKEIEELEKKLEREAMVMSKEMQEEKKREIRIKINDIKGLQRKYMEASQRLEARIVGRIQKEVFELVREMGKSGGYLMILEKRAGGVIYSPSTIDVTDELIKIYNESYKEKSQ